MTKIYTHKLQLENDQDIYSQITNNTKLDYAA